MVDGAGTTRFTWKGWGGIATEDGPWTSDTVTYAYNNTAQERSSMTLQQPSGSISLNYGYDGAHRLTSVSGWPGTFTYNYSAGPTPAPASRLWTQLNLPGGSIVRGFDGQGRLSSTQLRSVFSAVLDKNDYLYNNRHERTRHTRTDNSYVSFGYDDLGQLASAWAYTAAGSQITTEKFGYRYDAGWNLLTRTNNTILQSFSVNDRNELLSEPGGICGYDTNGNLTSDGLGRIFTYNAENQLIRVQSGTAYRTEFVYDGLQRKRLQREFSWNGSSWVLASERRYIYDGMLSLQERDANNNPLVTYTRGQDLSGSFEGAGGIGGLLARTASGVHHYYHADGNGNITALSDGFQLVANYKYDPFGRTLSQSGAQAAANTMRFSSKEIHPNSGMYYYGYRFYEPNLQRWINRDPIGEAGGINLYTFVYNSPVILVDPLGLFGFGATAGGTAQAGIGVVGAGATGSAGGGYFSGAGVGGYASGGAFAGKPKSTGGQGSVGLFGGVGGGLFGTNASSPSELQKCEKTFSLDIGFVIKGSFQFSWGGGVWHASVTAGPGLGVAGGVFNTSTATTRQ